MSEPLCQCGHERKHHKNGRGICISLNDRYFCDCDRFRKVTPMFKRAERLRLILIEALDMLEGWPEIKSSERDSLIQKIKRAV